MILSQINIFSLLIPFFMLGLGSLIIVASALYKIPQYFTWYAAAMLIASSSLLIFNISPPQFITQISFIPSVLLLLACVLTTHTIHLRLQLNTPWYYPLSVLISGIILLYIFKFIYHNDLIYLAVLTTAICLIFSQNIIRLFQLKPPHRLDRLLRACVPLIIMLAIGRAILLYTLVEDYHHANNDHLTLASTQFLVFFMSLLILTLLYGGTYQDILTRLHEERSTDPLTGLLNRRAIYEYLHYIQQNSVSEHAAILCDIDYFKKINDVYGHLAGDLALKHVSQLLSDKLRHHDRISRLGGEEFLIILENTSQRTAVNIAERLRKLIETTPFVYQGTTIQITVSFGVSTFKSNEDFKPILQLCDVLLYQAKKFGRNKVESELYT